uniref:Replication-associated protein n=1 Tax=Sweet potato symptomless virus 1 TaxID=603333 RepID=A0A2U8ZTA5_9GEMI|nr:replication-associated protein A [Sweet potato symptomless virus 1]AWO14289.1 replication-associated protein A [Sweet potato symptomless virus 1]AWO14294.1 replication-associated protein A [Sweet potato symptomless virus 1]AWO14299.1 replication-associated protein A [Sweet potato symptomless virus 1]
MPRQPRARSVFSFSSKYGFLTYSQCDLTAEIIQQMLITLLTPFNLLFLAVAPEHHQDGSLHFHVLFQCARRIITRRVDFFDLNNYHPNIQPARDSAAVLEYISKEQPPIVWGEFQNHKVSPSRRDDRWRDIIFTSTSKAEYLNRVKQEFPADYATRLQQLEYSAERLFPTTAPPYVSPFDPLTLQCHEDIQDWINRELYLVHLEDYILIHNCSYDTARQDLEWLDDLARNPVKEPSEDPGPSTYVVPPAQQRQPGQDNSGGTTTGTVGLTSPRTTVMPHTTSPTTSHSNSSQAGSN